MERLTPNSPPLQERMDHARAGVFLALPLHHFREAMVSIGCTRYGQSLARHCRAARPMTLWSVLRWQGRRQDWRRAGEGHQASSAGRARRTIGLALFVCVASLLDALLTLGHLARGGEEANPVLALALTHGTTLFLQLKIVLTGAGVWILAAHQQFPLAARGLYGLALGYGALLVYHLLLYVCLV